jgi:hypothetical protein
MDGLDIVLGSDTYSRLRANLGAGGRYFIAARVDVGGVADETLQPKVINLLLALTGFEPVVR